MAAWGRWAAARIGLLPHLQAAAAALGSSAAAQRLAQLAGRAAQLRGVAGGGSDVRGPLHELLWGLEKRGGLDAAGIFSA